jgi:hypothetical protein
LNQDNDIDKFSNAVASGSDELANVAAVMITADLPGMAKPGQRIDINVSAIGAASSLRGGNLLLTSLRGVDGQIYALAQGALTSTGIDAGGAGSKVSVGVTTSARIPGGATVERAVSNSFDKSDNVLLNLRESDFTTANSIMQAINAKFGSYAAFKEAFVKSAVGNFGSGWTWLVKKPDGSVDIVNTGPAGTPLTGADKALLTVDVWEHAYYLHYQNKANQNIAIHF